MIGWNHQRAGVGQIAEFANDWDGYTGRNIPFEQRALVMTRKRSPPLSW
jgi:hypothetical protein